MSLSKAVLIGLDGATLDLVSKFARKGSMPNMKRLMEKGVTTEAFSALPPATSVNWNTIATGCYAGTHGVVAMGMHVPGEAPDVFTSGFCSTHCRAETIWQAVERGGGFPVLLKYTTSWPPKISRGVQVEGCSDPDSNIFAIGPRAVHTTRPVPWQRQHGATHARGPYVGFKYEVRPAAARGWKFLPDSKLPPLEFPVRITPSEGKQVVGQGLVFSVRSDGYDSVLLSPGKDASKAWITIGLREWSDWIRLGFDTANGKEEGMFRYRLFHLSPEGGDLRLYQSQVIKTEGWAYPGEVCGRMMQAAGPFQSISAMAVAGDYLGVEFQEELFSEEFAYQEQWLEKAARQLLGKYDWDFFATQFHAIDLTNHTFFGGLTEENHPHRDCAERVTERMYALSDKYVGEILDLVDEDALIVVTSDHGFIEPHRPVPQVNQILEEKGYIVRKETEVEEFDHETGKLRRVGLKPIDWTRSVAYESLGYIRLNLKGRERTGIVNPEDYDRLCDEIIEVLEEVRSPIPPNRHFVMIAMRREDAEAFGLRGDAVGDVIYFARPCLRGGHHGVFHASHGIVGSMRAVTVFAGPGVKKAATLKKPINLVDIAPTIASFMKVPTPAQAEGRVLREIFE